MTPQAAALGDKEKTMDSKSSSTQDNTSPIESQLQLFGQIAEKIISQQEQIIGPVAVEQAKQVPNLSINWPSHEVTITGDAVSVLNALVEQYKNLFGQISVEVCKEAAAKLLQSLSPDQLPESLK